MVQFINAQPLASIIATHKDLIPFLKGKHQEIPTSVMDAFVKSCGTFFSIPNIHNIAGYCLITWILGIGDRHLDNLLLSQSGTISV